MPRQNTKRRLEIFPTDIEPSSPKQSSKAAAAERSRDIRLGFLIHDVSRLRKRAFDEFMRPMGITRSQWWVVANLARNDGIVQTQFADVLDVGKASLGFVIDRLEANGLIERRTHPSDRRAKCVFLTKKAKKLLSKMLTVERSYDELILQHLTSEDRDELIRLLEAIKGSLNSMQLSTDDHEI